ncbi:MAG: hypothetical protein HY747_06225 [Elusimicrobia bacterium]|nr:hypothetical protein [Elusimicrobiota bacterium]
MIDESEQPGKLVEIITVYKADKRKIIAVKNWLIKPQENHMFSAEMKALERLWAYKH